MTNIVRLSKWKARKKPHHQTGKYGMLKQPVPSTIHNANCFDVLPTLADQSVDLILTDPPFGGGRKAKTRLAWDVTPDLAAMWAEFRRVIKPNGVIVIHATQPFSADVVISARDLFRYSMVWQKTRPTNFQHAKYQPLREHEDLLVFSPATCSNLSKVKMVYQPQGLKALDKPHVHKARRRPQADRDDFSFRGGCEQQFTNWPRSILKFASVCRPSHPTQKPEPLADYLIRTFCPEGGLVLDPFLGSGTTGAAALAAGRRFVGVEMSPEHFAHAKARIEAAHAARKAAA